MSELKKIAIVGASGLGKEIWALIQEVNKIRAVWDIVGFYDDAYTEKKEVYQNTYCLGTVEDLSQIKTPLAIVFAISDRNIVHAMVEKLQHDSNFSYPNIVHPGTEMYPGASMGTGNVIALNSILSSDVVLGDFNFLNGLISIGHDAVIGNFNSIMPRVQISGNVTIGNFNSFGMSAAVLQGKKIGDHNDILSFTFLTKSIKDNRKYFGIPGKRIDI